MRLSATYGTALMLTWTAYRHRSKSLRKRGDANCNGLSNGLSQLPRRPAIDYSRVMLYLPTDMRTASLSSCKSGRSFNDLCSAPKAHRDSICSWHFDFLLFPFWVAAVARFLGMVMDGVFFTRNVVWVLGNW